MGADETIDVSTPEALAPYQRDKGSFDVVFECSAAGPALISAFQSVKPRGTIVQVGVTGEVAIPLNMLVGKEIVWRGSQRFHEEFARAVELIGRRAIDVRPILSHTFPIDEALAYRDRVGNRMDWYSSADSSFGADMDAGPGEGFGVNVFLRDGDTVYRTWHTNGRGTERLSHLQGLVDLLPYGRQEEWEDSPEGWPQHPTYAQGMGSREIAELYGVTRD